MSSDRMVGGIPSLLNHRVGAEEIHDIYSIVLGRPPESSAVIDAHVRTGQTVGEFIRTALESPEFRARQLELALLEMDSAVSFARRVDVDCDPAQMAQLMAHAQSVWTAYGETEPHWSVLTDVAFKLEAFDGTTEAEFYATGAADAAVLRSLASTHGLRLPVEGRVLDLGCGVGRVGEHLAEIFAGYDGVDVSPSHLKLAAERFATLGRANARFFPLHEQLERDDQYDCVYSILVLQHNPPPMIAYLINHLLACLRPGGIGLFQVPCALSTYEFDLAAYLETLPSRSEMEMHAIPQHVVLDAIRAHGCRLVERIDDGRNVPSARSVTFMVEKTIA